MIQNTPLAFRPFMNHKVSFTSETTNLICDLQAVAVQKWPQFQQVGPELFQYLQKHPRLQNISRLCLAKRCGSSSRVAVLTSASKSTIADTMQQGYWCFVNPTGSLMNSFFGKVRVYGEIDNIVEDFTQRNTPVQRSIAKIAKMGHQSGLCFSLSQHQGDEYYLFLNSCIKNYFDDDPTLNFILTHLFLVCRILIQQFTSPSPDYYFFSKMLADKYTINKIQLSQLEHSLGACSKAVGLTGVGSFQCETRLEEHLFQVGDVLQALFRLQRIAIGQTKLLIRKEGSKQNLCFELSSSEKIRQNPLIENYLETLKKDLQCVLIHLEYQPLGSTLQLQVPVEPAYYQDSIQYSVEESVATKTRARA